MKTRYVLFGLAAVGLSLFACANSAQAYDLGPLYISGVNPIASTWWPNSDPNSTRLPACAVDGLNRYTTNPDGTPGVEGGGIWLASGPTESPPDTPETTWIKFDLGSLLALDRVDVYNCNESAVLNRGVASMNVSYSTDDVGYTLLGNYAVAQAPGAADPPWGPSASIDLGGVTAQYVLFDTMTSHGASSVCLNEVEFYRVPEPSTLALLGAGLLGLAVVARRRRK